VELDQTYKYLDIEYSNAIDNNKMKDKLLY